MTVGYGYLAAATGRPEDKDEQITSMDLEGIHKYMCPISNGDFRRCQNCQGLKTCRVGQWVVVLLNQRDQKNESAKWAKVMDVPDKPANQDDSKRQFLREACLSGNAWEYVMRKTGKSRDAAKELLLELIRKYPGIAAEYGGSRRIMQRPRVTVIANHQEQQPEQVLSPVEPETPQAEKDPNDGRRKTALAIAEKRREEALALYRECLQASDPIAQYMERRNATESAARLFFSRMRKKYGEMESEAKEPQMQQEAEARAEPPAGPEADPQPQTSEDDDSISLEEFLGQFAAEDQETPESPQNGPEKAWEEPDEEILAQYRGARDIAQKTRENAGFAMETLKTIMVSESASHADRIRAAEVMLQFFARASARRGEQ